MERTSFDGIGPSVKTRTCSGLSFALVLLWLECVAMTASAALNVIATTPDLASIARELGGRRVNVTSLAKPTEDAHFIDPKPSFIVRMNRADVLIEGGADLESGWLPSLLAGARNPKLAEGQPGRVIARSGIRMLEVPETLDRSQGDLHAGGNPHFLIAPSNARKVAVTLAAALERLDPEGTETYREGMKAFQSRLDSRLEVWKHQLSPHRGRRVVAYHNSWAYFAAEFELRADLLIEPKPGVPPSAARLGQLTQTIRDEDVRVVLVEPYLSRRVPETLAEKTGIKVVAVSQFPGGIPGTEAGYIELLDALVAAISRGLSQPLARISHR